MCILMLFNNREKLTYEVSAYQLTFLVWLNFFFNSHILLACELQSSGLVDLGKWGVDFCISFSLLCF